MIDLHLHSHHSDGTWAPSALVRRAMAINMRHIALTDHDTVAGIAEAKEAADTRLEIIPGVEINTIWQDAAGQPRDIHILGYFIDTKNEDLLNLLSYQRKARLEQVEALVQSIALSGLSITVESVKQCAGIGSIGRAHITRAIVRAGGAKDISEAYEKYMSRSSPHHQPRKSVSPIEAIRAIESAGGISSIAHPGKDPDMCDLILTLKESGLKAVEAFHRIHSVTLVKRYIKFANRHGLLITGGSDCHGPFESFQSTMGSISIPTDTIEKLRRATTTAPAICIN